MRLGHLRLELRVKLSATMRLMKHLVDGHRSPVHGKATDKASAGAGAHGLPLRRGEIEPAAQQARGTVDGVVVDQAGAVAFDIAPDVHLIADEHWPPYGEGFYDSDAEILLVRWQHESIASPERSPFGVAQNRPGQCTLPATPSNPAKPISFACIPI